MQPVPPQAPSVEIAFRVGSKAIYILESGGPQNPSRQALHLDGRADRCTWSSMYLVQFNRQKQIFRRVTDSADGGFFDCLWEHLFMQLLPDLTVPTTAPAFEVSAPSQQFNSNTLRNLKCLSSNDQPFFRFTCNAQQRNNNCFMSQINFAACYGGMVHWYSAGNWTCEGLVQFDLDTDEPTRNDGFFLGCGPIGPGPACRHMTFIGCDRRGGTLGSRPTVGRVYDVRLEAVNGRRGAEHVALINCGEQTTPNYEVQANNAPITWIGMDEPDTEILLLGRDKAVRIGGNGEVRAPIITSDAPCEIEPCP